MRVTYLSCLIPHHVEEEVRSKSKRNMQDAANALEWHIYEGLVTNLSEPVRIFNVLPVGSFPQYYKDPFIKKETFISASCKDNINVGFCNIKLIRKFVLPDAIYKSLLEYYKGIKDPGVLFVYTASAPFMTAVANLKQKVPGLKVCCIVADLPNLSNLSSNKGVLLKAFIRYQSKKAYSHLNSVDYFVLLTKYMADYMDIHCPYCVMEGIATKTDKQVNFSIKKTIMYSGTLHKRFGVLNLLQAFQKIDDREYELIICGVGDSEKDIKAAAAADNRISFYGQLRRDEVLRIQKNARVLVNPRQNNEEFTKYSFPSKDMEYLSSGIPTIAYKLDGIPDEYDDYLIYPQDNSIDALMKALIYVCELNQDEWKMQGDKGRNFVLKNKNAQVQMKRILKMFDYEK